MVQGGAGVAQRGGGLAERSGGERLRDRDERLVLGVFAGPQAAQPGQARLGGGDLATQRHARAATGIPGTKASTSASIEAASSGSRVSVLRSPVPNPGRAWPSSGRASTSTYTGRSRTQSIR